MSNIVSRWQLDNDTKGVFPISEPVGGNDMSLKLERNVEDGFYGLIQLFSSEELGFYGDAKDYIQDVIDTQGIDAEIRIDVDISTDGETFEDYFSGIIDLETKSKDDSDQGEVLSAGVYESSFYQTFRNRMDNKVDLESTKDLSGNNRETINSHTLTTHTQKIRKEADVDFETI